MEDLTIGCEGDIVSTSGCLSLKAINGINPYLADMLSVNARQNTIEISHCTAPVSLSAGRSKVSIVERTDPKSAGHTTFAHFDFRRGPVTLMRFYRRNLDKVHMTSGYLKASGNYWGGISPRR